MISIIREGDVEIEKFIDEVCSCKKIFSSSLHGLIIAQTYGIPAQWIQLCNQPIHKDQAHKFYDYFEGVGQIQMRPYPIDETNFSDTIQKIVSFSPRVSCIPKEQKKLLMDAFPFDIL